MCLTTSKSSCRRRNTHRSSRTIIRSGSRSTSHALAHSFENPSHDVNCACFVIQQSFDERHSTTIATVAEAIHEARSKALRNSPSVDNIFQLQLSQIEAVSESMLRTHLSASLLMQQMVNIMQRRQNLVGNVNVQKCVEQQIIAVTNLAEHAGLANVRFEICTPGEVTAVGVEPIIEHPIHEVLKNAAFATAKHHQSKNLTTEPPPIKIMLHESPDYIYVVVEDEVLTCIRSAARVDIKTSTRPL